MIVRRSPELVILVWEISNKKFAGIRNVGLITTWPTKTSQIRPAPLWTYVALWLTTLKMFENNWLFCYAEWSSSEDSTGYGDWRSLRYKNKVQKFNDVQMENRNSKIASCLFFVGVFLACNLLKVSFALWLSNVCCNFFLYISYFCGNGTAKNFPDWVCKNLWAFLVTGRPSHEAFVFCLCDEIVTFSPLCDGSVSIVLYWKRTLWHTVQP